MADQTSKPDESVGPAPGTVRLTRQELMDSHVDDLLRRQMSLRGERGISRNRRRWYFQNWFVFMIVGMIAALTAWAIIEPFFDDSFYLQGAIEKIDRFPAPTSRLTVGFNVIELARPVQGVLTINGDDVYLPVELYRTRSDGEWQMMTLTELQPEQLIGLHVEYDQVGPVPLALGFLVESPPSGSPPAKNRLPLAQQHRRKEMAGLLIFSLIAGLIGLGIGAVDGLICRLWRRAILGGGIGLLVGVVGGFIAAIFANVVYTPFNLLAVKALTSANLLANTLGFVLQIFGRTLGWGIAGMMMGLGQGIALRSKRLFIYGLIGGLLGGLLGGMLFDPIDLLVLGPRKTSAHVSRLIGFLSIGLIVGAMIGIVELLSRDAWLRMTEGPLAGKEFLIFKDTLRVGSSPRSDLYLFNDDQVAAHHATIRAVADECELENLDSRRPALVNGRPAGTSRLRHGDQIVIGRTAFVFEKRRG